ncbi:MAG TPA: DNRLRE domain-containing protein, partial [Luteolibacter sp.]|nr:DNRLRE domain-containing protein [Luteolibacter sp.]
MKNPLVENQSIVMMAAAFGLAFTGIAQAQAQPSLPGSWTLDFEENFDGSTLDGTKWRMGGHHSGIAGSGGNAPENITVSGGALRLKAEQRAVTFGGANYSYATGEVSTFANYRQRYGYYEARVKYPAVTGLWPAFWLMPDRGTYGDASVNRRSYLKFDLTGSGISSVSSATLVLKVSAMETGPTNNLMVFKTGDGWSEGTINWNNKPVMDPVMVAQKYNNAVVVGDTISIDVTPYVAQQIAGDKIVSMVLADIYMRAKLLGFHSSEATNVADRAKLVINGTDYVATEDATVRGGTYAATNYGNAVSLDVKDNWGNTADTFNGGMELDVL